MDRDREGKAREARGGEVICGLAFCVLRVMAFRAAMSASASVTSNKQEEAEKFARLGPAHLTHKTNTKYTSSSSSSNNNNNNEKKKKKKKNEEMNKKKKKQKQSEPQQRASAQESHSKVNQLSSFETR